MPNYVQNEVKLSAATQRQIDQARKLVKEHAQQHGGEIHLDCLNLVTGDYLLEFFYKSTWSPSFDLYEQLEAIDGLVVAATWLDEVDDYNTRRKWTGKGDEYEVVESDLNDCEKTARIESEQMDRFIARLTARRDACDQAIRELREMILNPKSEAPF